MSYPILHYLLVRVEAVFPWLISRRPETEDRMLIKREERVQREAHSATDGAQTPNQYGPRFRRKSDRWRGPVPAYTRHFRSFRF